MASQPDWVPAGVDVKRANVARVYNYLLGGTHNFLVDQDVARTMLAVEPAMREIMRANRAFLGRAIRCLTARGVRQFLDIGSGIPTQGHVHEIAQRSAPDSRVVYVDIDPVAVAHSQMILRGDDSAACVFGDLREPEAILDHETTRAMIDFDQPVGLILAAILHFIPDSSDPAGLVARLTEPMSAGSCVVISHATDESRRDTVAALEKVYNRNVSTNGYFRNREDIRELFGDLKMLDPGLVAVSDWRPDPPGPPPGSERVWGTLVGVARKPAGHDQ